MQQAEHVCAALADETRLRILALLAHREVCVCDLHHSLGISQPKASRHLGHLRRVGLVETRRAGLWVLYRLTDVGDPFVTGLLEAVTRALATIPTVQRDARKLDRATGCAPAASSVARVPPGRASQSASIAPPVYRTTQP